MRTRTESRRQAILQAAAEVFQRMGYERASMSDICAQVGYSKATLYGYFRSKEELFYEVMTEATEAEFQATHDALDPAVEDIGPALQRFGESLLTLLYSPQVQAVRRLVIAEAGRSDLGKRCYELGPARSQAVVARFLEDAMEEGKLRRADPRLAALHLHGLLEAEWLNRFLFQTVDQLSPRQINEAVERAVAVFMAAYGPAGTAAGKPAAKAPAKSAPRKAAPP
jgi:AcrR family transcriptional regulator